MLDALCHRQPRRHPSLPAPQPRRPQRPPQRGGAPAGGRRRCRRARPGARRARAGGPPPLASCGGLLPRRWAGRRPPNRPPPPTGAPPQGDNTALHWAAMRGHVEVVRALVVAGADRAAVNKQGATPLDLTDPQVGSGGAAPALGARGARGQAGAAAGPAAALDIAGSYTSPPPPPPAVEPVVEVHARGADSGVRSSRPVASCREGLQRRPSVCTARGRARL
jgi:hypothetical protein